MRRKCLLSILLLLFLMFGRPAPVQAEFALAGSNTLTGTVSVAMPVTGLQITGTGSEPIPVKLFVTSGTLSMSTTTGLTFDGASSGSTIYFSGTQTNVNNALATLTYTRGSTGTDTLEISLVPRGEVFFTDNSHLYKFISGSITANNARTSAAAQTAYGATGYLATITSLAENNFVAARLQGDGWIGASDATTEGDWKWITGPEAGTSFWSGVSNGSTVGGNYANWASGEPNDYQNGVPGEDCAQFYITNSQWNDLPCSGSNLSGYVVEFGAPGNMPTVVAKNVSITTGSNPTVSSFTPADNATGISLDANLVVAFSQTVTRDTGNILLKKSSDDSTVETIDVTSSQVTGSGSSTITINPNTTLSENTGYYVTIPSTAFKNGTNNYFAGIDNGTTWNFTIGDFTNPTITDVASTSLTTSGATIAWTTTENSSSRISYGLTTSYGTQTSETDTSPRVTSHSVALTGLLSCTTYHYTVTSRDASTNSATSSDNTFTTIGCTASSTPTQTTSESVTVASGGTTTLTESNNQITVQTPPNVTNTASSVVIQIKSVESEPVLTAVGHPADVARGVGDSVFDVKAIVNGTTVLDSFDAPVTITYHYIDADIAGLNESTLWLYHYHNSSWQKLNDCSVDTGANTVTCTTTSFSIFGLFGQFNNSTPPRQPDGPVSCTALAPLGSTNLFQIDASHAQAKVYFSPLNQHVTNYYISYGYAANDQRFGAFTNLGASNGVLSYTVNYLAKNTTYYLRIQPYNDCQAGEWSNEMQFTTKASLLGSNVYYKSSPMHSLSIFPSPLKNLPTYLTHQIASPTKVLGSTTNSCEYTVQSGDSLWSIALNTFGTGTRYGDIMKENDLQSSQIKTGTKLKTNCAK